MLKQLKYSLVPRPRDKANSDTPEDNNYQPLIPPRILNQENKYHCLSPTQECILGQYENDSVVVFNPDGGKEKKDTYYNNISCLFRRSRWAVSLVIISA